MHAAVRSYLILWIPSPVLHWEARGHMNVDVNLNGNMDVDVDMDRMEHG